MALPLMNRPILDRKWNDDVRRGNFRRGRVGLRERERERDIPGEANEHDRINNKITLRVDERSVCFFTFKWDLRSKRRVKEGSRESGN